MFVTVCVLAEDFGSCFYVICCIVGISFGKVNGNDVWEKNGVLTFHNTYQINVFISKYIAFYNNVENISYLKKLN